MSKGKLGVRACLLSNVGSDFDTRESLLRVLRIAIHRGLRRRQSLEVVISPITTTNDGGKNLCVRIDGEGIAAGARGACGSAAGAIAAG